MKRFTAFFAASLLFAISSLSLAADPPDYPGLGDLWENANEALQKQLEHREAMEVFSKQLRAWWRAENKLKPIPYLKIKGKKVPIPGVFLKAYIKAKESNNLKADWKKIERDLKSDSFLLEVSG